MGVVIPLSTICTFPALYYLHKANFMSYILAFLFSDLLFSLSYNCSINLIVCAFGQTFVPISARLREISRRIPQQSELLQLLL